MRLYLQVIRYGFRRHSTYRVAAGAGAFTNTVFGFIRAYVLIALWQARPGLAGYDVTDAITFCFLTQAMIGPMQIFGGSLQVAARIRTGDIAIDLHRPIDLQLWWLCDDLGRAGFQFIVRSVPPTVAGALVFSLRFPQSPGTWLLFGSAVVLGVIVSFAIRYLVALSAFWITDDRGVATASLVMMMFFSGMILPLGLFPGWLGSLAEALPWAAVVQVPADVFLGKSSGITPLVFQAFWAVVLLLLGRLVTAAARRRVVVQGG